MAILKYSTVVALITAMIALVALFAPDYFASEESTNTSPGQQKETELLSGNADAHAINSARSLFTDEMICKAITNAIVGADLAAMTATRLNDKIVTAVKSESSGNSSYECTRVDNRYYLESASKFVSQSIIEIEPKVEPPRIDELVLYIFDTSDRGNIVKNYNIEQLE